MEANSKCITRYLPELKELWTQTLGHPSIKVAVIDGPVSVTHPVLVNAQLDVQETFLAKEFEGKGAALEHGTHVTSIIFGQHDSELKGVAPNCAGLILPVFNDTKTGDIQPCSQLILARTILQAAANGANIINISGGELSTSGVSEPILSDALEHCKKNNILVVAAAGNDGCACSHIPGAEPWVIAVGAMNEKGIPLAFSNWGTPYRLHGILAPGENIEGAGLKTRVKSNTGTSYATPIVSGIAALLMSIQQKQGQQPNANKVREALLESAHGCENLLSLMCQKMLKGRLNISGAYSLILKKEDIMSESNEKQESHDQHPNAINPDVLASNPKNDVCPSFTTSTEPVTKGDYQRSESGIQASGCGCGCGGGNEEECTCQTKPSSQAPAIQLVYALGTLGYDLVSESRQNSIQQHLNGSPNDPAVLLSYLEQNPWEAASIIWTLKIEATPIYAIQPYGPFAADGFNRLRQFLADKVEQGADRISVPGYLSGQTKLMSGQTIPIILPNLRCMYNWNTAALVESVVGKPLATNAKKTEKEVYENTKSAIANFLERIYHELRNLGTLPQDRAINYAATNALNTATIFTEALKDNMQLDLIEVERSAVCPLGSECWDVKIIFFDPEKQFQRARKVYRFTIDVSDVCPVMIGEVRHWSMR